MTYSLSYIVGEKNRRPLELDGSVAVVGNSDSLIGSGLGSKIDSFDNVFRFNLASLDEEFFGDIGARADYFLMSQNITTYKFPHTKELYMRFVSHCRNSQIICYPGHSKNVRKFNKKPYLLKLVPRDANDVFTRALMMPSGVRFSGSNHPRNGIKLLACLLDAGIRPTLFGFDLRKKDSNSHYFDNEEQIDSPTLRGHKPSWEYQLLQELLDANVMDVVN